jgi:hypothetical protein
MKEDKWYHDTQAKELINLRDCKGIWIEHDREKEDNYNAAFTLIFVYYGNASSIYLHYESSKLLHNAFEHYSSLLACSELDVSSKPITL